MLYILSTPDGVWFQGLAPCSLMNSDGVSLRESQALSAPGLYKFEGQPEIKEDSSKPLRFKPHVRLTAQKGAFSC